MCALFVKHQVLSELSACVCVCVEGGHYSPEQKVKTGAEQGQRRGSGVFRVREHSMSDTPSEVWMNGDTLVSFVLSVGILLTPVQQCSGFKETHILQYYVCASKRLLKYYFRFSFGQKKGRIKYDFSMRGKKGMWRQS